MLEIHDIVGATGAAILLLTYFLLQVNRLAASSMLYSQLNFIGSGMIVFSLCYDFNLSALVIEVAWMVISLIGAWVTWKQTRNARAEVLEG